MALSIPFSDTNTLTKPNSIYIFSRNIGNVANYISTIKFVSFKIYENNILVKDFAPAEDSDGVAALYEKIERKFYYLKTA